MKEKIPYELTAPYSPSGDQQEAIDALVEGIEEGKRTQVLLGVTGSGKTFTMANVIARCGKPALVIAHNKTLAAQLCNEFRELFPRNRVEYFVSYYDYYQPEAYIPRSDTYIEKERARRESISSTSCRYAKGIPANATISSTSSSRYSTKEAI